VGPGKNVELEVVEVGDERYMLVSWPIGRAPVRVLTTAESEVLRLVALGKSNAEIASVRGTSPRTVANQVVRLLRKFAVTSRIELVAAVSR
jgi:DNA-binding NarL/FixJ family response regulator